MEAEERRLVCEVCVHSTGCFFSLTRIIDRLMPRDDQHDVVACQLEAASHEKVARRVVYAASHFDHRNAKYLRRKRERERADVNFALGDESLRKSLGNITLEI